MKVEYDYTESSNRYYQGISFEEDECHEHLSGPVKENLLDKEERDEQLENLRSLQAETGFEANEQLLLDIQALENENVHVQTFRIGEAYAEIALEEHFQCRFHWNENRDARNPKGNKTGADLVGFIEIDGSVLFLFGEVKTSSDTTNTPPTVMTGKKGIEGQLRDLYGKPEKRRILIGYLQNKAKLFPDGHPFKDDFEASKRAYYSANNDYQLIGVLVRDVAPDEQDISISYGRLKQDILDPAGLQLLALYLPIRNADWLSIINKNEDTE